MDKTTWSFLLIFGPPLALIGFGVTYNSSYFVKRRVAKWQRDYEAQLRQESVSSLRDRILKSDYWGLTEQSSLRETTTVKEFFRRFDAEKYDEILTELDDGNFMYSVFHAAERSIGYRDRPMIMDYAGLFIPVLKELRRRKGTEALQPSGAQAKIDGSTAALQQMMSVRRG
ncbi:MAG: hypothetical protein QM784_09870 [Polyangiaceae bacterium]